MTIKYRKSVLRTFRIRTYDVWGNAADGWEVNDVFSHGTVTIRVRAKIFNHGTPAEFVDYSPTDRQLSRAVGGRGLVWEWTDGAYEASDRRGKPVGMLEVIDAD